MQNSMILAAATLVSALGISVPTTALAHHGHHHEAHSEHSAELPSSNEREWRMSGSAHPLRASFVLVQKSEKLKLERSDGSIVTLPVTDLAELTGVGLLKNEVIFTGSIWIRKCIM